MSGQAFTLYTYSQPLQTEPRWHDDEAGNRFFGSEQSVRKAVTDLRDDLISDPDGIWRDVQIERIQTVPVTLESLLALLNDGIADFIDSYEIIETIRKD